MRICTIQLHHASLRVHLQNGTFDGVGKSHFFSGVSVIAAAMPFAAYLPESACKRVRTAPRTVPAMAIMTGVPAVISILSSTAARYVMPPVSEARTNDTATFCTTIFVVVVISEMYKNYAAGEG